MIENRNQFFYLFKSKSETDIESCLPILYMCLSKHFKKEYYEKINERGEFLFTSCILKGANIDSKLCFEGWKNWGAGWPNEAKISIFNLFKFLWVSSAARPSTLVSF